MHFLDNHSELVTFDVEKVTAVTVHIKKRIDLNNTNVIVETEPKSSPSKRIENNVIFTCPMCPQFWTSHKSRYFRFEFPISTYFL